MDETGSASRADTIAAITGYRFADPALLELGLTHSSRCPAQWSVQERRARSNERLEFLGDALLGAAICLALYRRRPGAGEGELSRIKSQLASRSMLAEIFDAWGLGPVVLVGPQMRPPWPASVKANLVEALFAAAHLDGGFDVLCAVVERLYGERLDRSADADAKTRLLEWCHRRSRSMPQYECSQTGGSAHAPEFTATARFGEHAASGSGGTRQAAETAAAEALLARLAAGESSAT